MDWSQGDYAFARKKIVVRNGEINEVDHDYFRKYIYDYRNESKFISKSDKTIVIDFWVNWCNLCK